MVNFEFAKNGKIGEVNWRGKLQNGAPNSKMARKNVIYLAKTKILSILKTAKYQIAVEIERNQFQHALLMKILDVEDATAFTKLINLIELVLFKLSQL